MPLLPGDFLKKTNTDWLMVIRTWIMKDDINADVAAYKVKDGDGKTDYCSEDSITESKVVSEQTRRLKLIELGEGKHWDDVERFKLV